MGKWLEQTKPHAKESIARSNENTSHYP